MRIPACYVDGYQAARAQDPELADAYIRHVTIGDPAADAVVDELETLADRAQVHAIIERALSNGGSVQEGTPESLRRLVAEVSVKPDWYDSELALHASRAFIRNADVVLAALSTAAIIEGFSTLIAKSFRIRGRIMQNGVRRLKQNLLQLLEQFLPGQVEPAGDAWRLTLRIRLIHAQARKLIRRASERGSEWDSEWDEETLGTPLSAAHMLLGASAFSGRLMQHVAALGGDFSAEEREGYVHVWRRTALTMGIPSEITFHDEASALRMFQIGVLCEPPPDEDSIIMANSIINSTPLVLGIMDSRSRAREARRYYQLSRELIGGPTADSLRYPPAWNYNILPLLRLKHRATLLGVRAFSRFGRAHRLRGFNLLLQVSDLKKFEHSYKLPTELHDENSKRW